MIKFNVNLKNKDKMEQIKKIKNIKKKGIGIMGIITDRFMEYKIYKQYHYLRKVIPYMVNKNENESVNDIIERIRKKRNITCL